MRQMCGHIWEPSFRVIRFYTRWQKISGNSFGSFINKIVNQRRLKVMERGKVSGALPGRRYGH